MKTFKTLISVLLVMAMLLSFAACSGSVTPTVDNGTSNNGTDNTTPSDDAANDNTSDDNTDDNTGDNTDDVPDDGTTGDDNSNEITKPEIPAQTVELADFLNALKDSPYTLLDKVTDSNVGLLDSKNVGVDQDRFENEILYPVPADSEFAHIYKASDYGISPENENNSIQINDLLREIKSVDGLKKIEFEPGVYLCKTTLVFDQIDDLYFCCADTSKYFEIRMTAWTQAFSVDSCDNIHFNNYELDYDPSPTISGTIKSYDMGKREIIIEVEDEFDLTHPYYNGGKLELFGGRSYLEFTTDPITGAPVPDPTKNLEGISKSTYDDSTHCITITVPNMVAPNVGARVSIAFRMYEHFGFYASNCGDVYIEGAHIYTTGGMAYCMGASKGFYVNNVKLDLREGSKRLMTATADGFHTCDVQNILVTNSIFQYSHDDAFNIKNSYIEVTGAVNKKITIKASESYVIEPGDVIDIYTNEYFAPLGPYTVTRVERKTATSVDVYLDSRVDEDAVGCLMANITKSTKITIDNNIIGNKRNRGILLQTQGAVIKNNTWRNIVHGGIKIFTLKDQFAEGICPGDVIVENNKFLGSYHGDVHLYTWGTKGTTPGLMKNIVVRNNFSYNTKVGPIAFGGAGDSEISNNLLYNVASAAGANDCYAINLYDSVNVLVKANCIYLDNGVNMVKAITEGKNNTNITVKDNNFNKK